MDARYSRQVRFEAFGSEAQRRLEASQVWIVGIGALGTHVADQLVRAGAGHTVLIDRDVVERSNLQRQCLFTERDAAEGRPKAEAAAVRLLEARSDARLSAVVDDYRGETHDRLIAEHGAPDVIVDGTDNFATRFALNDLAVRDGIPWIYGGAVGATGAAAVILPGRTPCLRCRIPEVPARTASCETDGVLAPAVALVAAFQAMEALKILGGRDAAVTRGTLHHDLWRGTARIGGGSTDADPACRTCGTREFPALAAGDLRAATLCGRNAVQVLPRPGTAPTDLERHARWLDGTAHDVSLTGSMLRFTVDDVRFSVFADGRALLFGTADVGRAQALYDRWLGPAVPS